MVVGTGGWRWALVDGGGHWWIAVGAGEWWWVLVDGNGRWWRLVSAAGGPSSPFVDGGHGGWWVVASLRSCMVVGVRG